MENEKLPLLKRIKHALVGAPRNIFDPTIFHSLSLAVFFAWVGLGADGISSSCYGPEEAFLALGKHTSLAVFVALGTVVTIFVISSSYTQIIEMFPSGGGGYNVASKLLGSHAGVISGAALIIDYVLTITISVASGTDALFSLMPLAWQPLKFWCIAAAITGLLWLNFRGLKESVAFLMPIFFAFMLSHVPLVLYVVGRHFGELPAVASSVGSEVRATVAEIGWWGMLAVVLRAYSLGAGTFTGIEAVSNSMQTLREPRVQTGKRTMACIAVSLSVVAAGIMLGYLLTGVHHVPGKTLNAVLLENVSGEIWGHGATSQGVVIFVLAAEAFLLFVAAQSGFIVGPQVLANMAVDSYLPHRFANLSQRLVRKWGLVFMGGMAFLMLYITKGSVKYLVVMYSINVFITFTLSQFGMVVHWWKERASEPRWRHGIFVNGLGCSLTASILCITVVMKFPEGGWVTLVVTGALVAFCFYTKRHYRKAQAGVKSLDDLLVALPSGREPSGKEPSLRREAPTAVILVSGFNGLGMHVFFSVVRSFPGTFRNFVFVSVGVVDSSVFKGAAEVENLVENLKGQLTKYEDFVKGYGYYAESRHLVGTDVVEGIAALAEQVGNDFPNAVFFAGQLIFKEEKFFNRFLHNQTAFLAQKKLAFEGYPMIVMPIRALA
jgi:amino acid transporter